MFPDTSIKKTYTDLRGRIDLVKSPFIRYSPGLSLKYQEELPNQYAAFKDGDNQFVFYDITNAKKIDFARSTLSYAGYVACPNPEKALIIQVNGGIAIPCAISSRAANISIVQENPGIARLLKRHYSLPVFNQNPRGFLSASKERFDIIHIENWGYSIPGSGALNQDSFFTVEAFNSYLTHLSEKGIFIISRKLLLPPTDILRLFAAAFESLKLTGRKNPQDHIAIFGTWDSWTMLVSYSPIADVKSMLKFSNDLNFDIVYLKGISEKEANRFNVFERPYFSNEIRSLAAALQRGNEKEYFSKYPFDVSSQSDRRPFPDKLLKWSWLKQDYKIMGSRLYNLFLSGEVVVFTVFIEALVLSVILLFFPVFFIKRAKSKVNIYMLGYFFFIGSGFIFSELFFIKQWTIIFGDPSVSFSMVLSGILISSGLGGFFSQKLSSKSIKYVLILLIILTFLLFFLFNICLRYLIPCPKFLQYVLALIILMPPGFLMGIPFPMSMRYLFNNTGHNQAERAYAWNANGCASVLFSIVSVMIAVSIGIHAIIAAAAFSYFLALITFAAVRYKN
jgi:hypothetical protein